MIGYIITLITVITLLICGIITVINHPKNLSPAVIRLIAVAVLITYLYPLLEVVTNYSKESFTYLSVLPTYNCIPLLFLTVVIGSALIKNDAGKLCFTTVSLMIPYVFYNIMLISVYNITHNRDFSERNAIYLLGQVGTILLCIYTIRNKIVLINKSHVLISCLCTSGLYGLIAIYNVTANKNVFGLSLTENGYFISPYNLRATPEILFIINFAFIIITMLCTALVFALIQKKTATKEIEQLYPPQTK